MNPEMRDPALTNPANIAVNLERFYQELVKPNPDDWKGNKIDAWQNVEMAGYEILDIGEFSGDNGNCAKAIVVRDPQGNIYVHFNGTGDGNWGYNAVAYGPQDGKVTSPLQDWASDYFDGIMEEFATDPSAKVYVSGHSQGGNNAQYVTLNSEHGDRIENCISLDGPNFSYDNIQQLKDKHGEDYFNRQRDKIYAYNGENDYVSCLGQENIVPKGHTAYIEYNQDKVGMGDKFVLYHSSEGLCTEDDNGRKVINDILDDCSDFRKLVLALNERVKELPPDQQAEMAAIVMKIAENFGGSDEPIKDDLTPEELEKLKEILIPVLLEQLEEDPDAVMDALRAMGLDEKAVAFIEKVTNDFNDLSPETRELAFEIVASLLVVEDGQIKPSIPEALKKVWETAVHHPEQVLQVLEDLGVGEYLQAHPEAAVAGALFLSGLTPLIQGTDTILHLAEAVSKLVNDIKDFAANIKDFVLKTLDNIKQFILNVGNWLKKALDKGAQYAAKNPQIKVDTVKLRNYATRVYNVNKRLRQLDGDLRDLYWQVGFEDLWNILLANLLTSESGRLNRIEAYLNKTATWFEEADNSAFGNMGG